MKRCAVVIGVNKAGKLPYLPAAVDSAKEFENWAKTQNFDTTLIVDDKGPVKVSNIKEAVRIYIHSLNYDHILIYFAGHGVLKGPDNEQWLLSEFDTDPNEAVNVPASKFVGGNHKITYITFVSDACRSAMTDPLVNSVMGAIIFPNTTPGLKTPQIDMFFATRPGDPAYEAKDISLNSSEYKAIFTECMLKGLHGLVPSIKKEVNESGKLISVIYPYELKEHLDEEVPRAAERIKMTLRQNPSIEVASRPPSYLSKFDDSLATSPEKTTEDPNKEIEIEHELLEDISLSNIINKKKIKELIDLTSGSNEFFNLMIPEIGAAVNIDTGFRIIGSNKFEIVSINENIRIPQERNQSIVSIFSGEDNTAIFLNSKGEGTPLAILPGFVGDIAIKDERIVNVNYIPTKNNDRYDEFIINNPTVNYRRAFAAYSARNGTFRIDGNKENIKNTASYLRHQKEFDPTLGLYAAYAYLQAGNRKGVRSIFQYMDREREPVLFDVKLLAFLNERRVDKFNFHIAPFCPMLTQGWSYISINPELSSDLLNRLNSELIPGLWTTFTKKGVEILRTHKIR